MTIQLHAQPYDISAVGFYFEDYDDYAAKAAKLRNSYGDPVEEFEIQFIDGEAIDCDLAQAIGVNQANLKQYLDAVDELDTDDKTRIILAVGECGYAFTPDILADDFDLDIYPVETLRDLAEQFVDEGLFGDIPEQLQFYIDYDAIARDLSMDYAEAEVAGQRLIYRCA
ncbi:MAG: antirestriction protein ArdA [Pseudomonadota bacterium]